MFTRSQEVEMECFFVSDVSGWWQRFIFCHLLCAASPPSRDICVIQNSCSGRGANALCPSTPLDLATPLLRALGAFLRASLSHTGPSCEKLCSSSRSTIETSIWYKGFCSPSQNADFVVGVDRVHQSAQSLRAIQSISPY